MADASSTPLADPPLVDRSMSAFTIVCADWPAAGAPADLVGCDDAARLAIAAIGGDRARSVRRLDIGLGDPCPDGGSGCARSSTVRWVVARSAAYETLAVRVARDAAGELQVWPPAEGRPQPPPPFAAPPVAATDLGPDAPAAVRARSPVAFCGTEDLTEPDAFDSGVRQCFLDGVEGWVGVELVSTTSSTEGGALTTLVRFTGSGGVARYVRSGTGWDAAACAISPVDTAARFVLVRPCEPIALR